MKKALKQKNSCIEFFSVKLNVCQFILSILKAQEDISITFLQFVANKAVYLGQNIRFWYLSRMLKNLL